MNAKIICQNISKEKIKEAFNLAGYQKSDFHIFAIPYKMYQRGDIIAIEFEEAFDFCQMIFVMVDLLQISRNSRRDVQGFVNSDPTNKITEYLNGERVCFYLTEELKKGLKENEDKYLDMIDLVTTANKNYSIDIDHFFSYTCEDTRRFEEPDLKLFDYELIEEGEYLYEKGDFENEFLEDLENEK